MVDIKKLVDKAFETKTLKELADSPISALQGVTEADAKKIEAALNIKTINDLANNKFVRMAQAIAILAELDNGKAAAPAAAKAPAAKKAVKK